MATVILIAITLIAAIAVAGFVFGLFGSATNSPNLSAAADQVPAAMANGGAFTVSSSQGSCVTGVSCGLLSLGNTGTANTLAISVKLSYDGRTYTSTLATPLNAVADSTVFLYITALPAPAANEPACGTEFIGSIATSDGAIVPFAGTFE